ncbi:MAG: hypothetical protein RDV48_09535 [Candidatus Eremiobacteraeota bacterium]|nr:hypothetical protein [Candidatus Eremiobacteraeota bacterium]
MKKVPKGATAWKYLVIIAFTALLIQGCGALKKDQKADECSQAFITALLEGKSGESYQFYASNARETVSREKHHETVTLLQSRFGPFQDLKIDYFSHRWFTMHSTKGGDTKLLTMLYSLFYSGKYALVQLHLLKNGTSYQVMSWTFTPTATSLIAMNKFSLEGKSMVHFVFLLIMAAEVIFILYVIKSCIGSSMKRKYFWSIFSLAGIPTVSFNWFTGKVFISYLTVQFLFGVAWNVTIFGLMLTASLPLGAFIALLALRSHRLKMQAEKPPEEQPGHAEMPSREEPGQP